MLSEKIEGFGRNEVNAVIHPVSRCLPGVIEMKLSGNPTTIDAITRDK
jgi:hypothetical protein